MSNFQIFIAVGNGPMEPHRLFECMGNPSATENEAMEALKFGEEEAQFSAYRMGKSVSIELRDITNNYVLSHKRFMPRDIVINGDTRV